MFLSKKQFVLIILMLTIFLIGLLSAAKGKFVITGRNEDSTIGREIFDVHYEGNANYLLAGHNLIVQDLQLEIRREKANQVDIRLVDKDRKQYQIPHDQEPFKSTYLDIENPDLLGQEEYEYDVLIQNDPLEVRVVRKVSNETIFQLTDIEFSLYYIVFKSQVCTNYFFGLGERNQRGFRFQRGQYTLMARDVPKLVEDGKRPGKHVYSSQPVYLMKEKSSNYHMFFYKTASPIDVDFVGEDITWTTIGGVIHVKLFIGDQDPENAVRQYHQYLGGSYAVPPFWSLGFHQSRWTYKSAQILIGVIQKHKENRIPLDTIWSDLDYMFDRQIFSVNNLYPMSDYRIIKEDLNIKYVPLLDVAVGVKYGKSDPGYAEGIKQDIFLRSPEMGRRFHGQVWPGDAFFPDFFHPNITEYWYLMLKNLQNSAPFDGIWSDMNEPTNFCDGECNWNRALEDDDYQEWAIQQKIDFPYLPGGVKLQHMTLTPYLKHYNRVLHKDVHNLYGYMDSWVTTEGLKRLGFKQPFQLSRSTFAGSGRWTQHWFGDNSATWDFLYMTISQVFQFNFFGYPMVGADACGFMDNTEEKLCSRWIQVAALQPFFRNHNNDQSKPQEFYNLGPVVLKTAQRNIKLRYSLLKWYYMLYFRGGRIGTIYRPLFFEFPADNNAFADDVLDTQIMLGQELMSTPVVQKNLIIRKAYFPKDTWYEFLTGLLLQKSTDVPRYHMIYNPLDDFVPLYIRGGSIVLQQDVQYVHTTKDLTNKYQAVVAFDLDDKGILEHAAKGSFLDLKDFLDDGEIIDNCYDQSCVLDLSVEVTEELVFTIADSKGQPAKNLIKISEISVYGLTYAELQVHCVDGKGDAQRCILQRTNYNYNTKIIFEKGILFGGDSENTLIRLTYVQ